MFTIKNYQSNPFCVILKALLVCYFVKNGDKFAKNNP